MAFDYANVIRGLLASAEDESYPDNIRAAYRAKAEELMIQYRIEEEKAVATNVAGAVPIRLPIVISDRYGQMGHWYVSVFSAIAAHTGVRFVLDYSGAGRVAQVVGYEGDIRYTEFLWTAALLMFSTRIDPEWSADRSEAENIFLLRNAGIERRKIADMAWGKGREASARSKVQRIYLKECARRGEPARASGLSHNTLVYREAYAREFRDTLVRRLQEARDAADSVTGGLVLHGRAERVNEAFYGFYPSYRPTNEPTKEPEPCPNCQKAKSGHCRRHPAVRWTNADQARWERFNVSPSANAGAASGRAAAEGVIIERGHTRATRLDASGKAIEG